MALFIFSFLLFTPNVYFLVNKILQDQTISLCLRFPLECLGYFISAIIVAVIVANSIIHTRIIYFEWQRIFM
jgi:hypothetical protein